MTRAEKDGHTRQENQKTQPLKRYDVFNNPDVLTEAWYPVFPSRELKKGKARSHVILRQRIVLFRGEDGKVRALDAFCPHMGADLANGRVLGNEIQCYFHQWKLNGRGEVTEIPCAGKSPEKVRISAWPVEEKYGFVWVYSAENAPYPVPVPPGLEEAELVSLHIGSPTLYAHHHVMMVGGIDLLHFATVHQLDIRFELSVNEIQPHVADWNLKGEFPTRGWRARLGRALLGNHMGYIARFAGGSIVTLTYGPDQRLRGTGPKLPPLHILWGAVPQTSGVSRVQIFLVYRKRKGIVGRLKTWALYVISFLLLAVLKDDDIKAFPNMRFNPGNLTSGDESAARLIRMLNGLPVSRWSAAPLPPPKETT